jgi:hypothetical protein
MREGRLALIEVLGTPDGSLYYRVFGRGDKGRSRVVAGPGPLPIGTEVTAFGGKANMPMSLSFRVESYLPAGRERKICVPIHLPKSQMGNGLAAARVEMTANGHTQEFWVRQPQMLDSAFDRVTFPNGDIYEVAYDCDRKSLSFELRLDDFDVGFDPGTQQASKFVSQVRLTDKDQGIEQKPYTISMNEPLTHRGYTFYQSSYVPMRDRSGRETGQFQSIFQVGIDPGRTTKYVGCLMVVLGAFVQFYMRAGVFTDGGKRERERAAAKARKRAEANGAVAHGDVPVPTTALDEPL